MKQRRSALEEWLNRNQMAELFGRDMKVERYISNDEIPETDKKFIKE